MDIADCRMALVSEVHSFLKGFAGQYSFGLRGGGASL